MSLRALIMSNHNEVGLLFQLLEQPHHEQPQRGWFALCPLTPLPCLYFASQSQPPCLTAPCSRLPSLSCDLGAIPPNWRTRA